MTTLGRLTSVSEGLLQIDRIVTIHFGLENLLCKFDLPASQTMEVLIVTSTAYHLQTVTVISTWPVPRTINATLDGVDQAVAKASAHRVVLNNCC